jgi:hypothetical protein
MNMPIAAGTATKIAKIKVIVRIVRLISSFIVFSILSEIAVSRTIHIVIPIKTNSNWYTLSAIIQV